MLISMVRGATSILIMPYAFFSITDLKIVVVFTYPFSKSIRYLDVVYIFDFNVDDLEVFHMHFQNCWYQTDNENFAVEWGGGVTHRSAFSCL